MVNLSQINLNMGDLNLREPCNDFEHLSSLLSGLGSEFYPFVTLVTTCVDPMSLEELYAHLLTHEMRLEHNTAIF